MIIIFVKDGCEEFFWRFYGDFKSGVGSIERVREKKKLYLSKDVFYILFGGFGGVGKVLVVFFVEVGVGECMFLFLVCYFY